ncbi:MAG: imidazoleglycerol-phosphate dehydratase HisB [Geminicoccaceae bacterium]
MSDYQQAPRQASVSRRTKETDIQLTLALDGAGDGEIRTGLGFLDHMLGALAKHGRFDLDLVCEGDVWIDDHHTCEDCALLLGQAFDQALGNRAGIARFGYAYAPLDEALARAVVDFSGRPYANVDLGLTRDLIGEVACENLVHVFVSLAMTGRLTLHVDVLRGDNDHHRAEAAFKAVALALRMACAPTDSDAVPSTKGVL